jgi:hypothetical protein
MAKRGMIEPAPIVLASAMVLIVHVCDLALAQNTSTLEVGTFSTASLGSALPEGWKPLTFKKIPKQTLYEVVKDGDRRVIKASSEASASGLTKEVKIDPREYPVVRWQWKVVSVGKKLKYKAGQVLFGDIPIGAINYVWERKALVGSVIDNAYTDFVKMVVVESGPQKLGVWIDEERNIYQDYKKAFGEEPPMINGVAIMSDTDNTKERATAYYGDITFKKVVE